MSDHSTSNSLPRLLSISSPPCEQLKSNDIASEKSPTERRMSWLELAHWAFYSVTIKDQRCIICKRWVLMRTGFPFGLLSNCSCCYCALCIVTFRQVHNTSKCPVCHADSPRVLIWSKWIEVKERKRKLIRLQQQANMKPIRYSGCMATQMQIWNEHPNVRRLFYAGGLCFTVAMLLNLANFYSDYMNELDS